MNNYDAPFVELIMSYFNSTNIDSETMHKMYIAYRKGVQVGFKTGMKSMNKAMKENKG